MTHLSEEQFSALLGGDVDAAAQQHLDACVECRKEMDTVRGSMESFSALGMEWAERRSATLPPVRLASGRGWHIPLVWAAGTAMVAAMVFAGWRMESPKPVEQVAAVYGPAVVPVAAKVIPVAKKQIAEDNRLMLAISQELSSDDSMLLPAGLRDAYARPQHRVND